MRVAVHDKQPTHATAALKHRMRCAPKTTGSVQPDADDRPHPLGRDGAIQPPPEEGLAEAAMQRPVAHSAGSIAAFAQRGAEFGHVNPLAPGSASLGKADGPARGIIEWLVVRR